MATDLNSTFNDQFLALSNKLKKRFLRKPNTAEVADELNALALQCELAEQPAYAGLTYMTAAYCENSVGNNLGEAKYLLTAARQFFQAELQLSLLKSYSPAREHIEAAIGCYNQALGKYPEGSMLRVAILMELANNLAKLKCDSEACLYYEEAMDCSTANLSLKVGCLSKMADIKIRNELYEEALQNTNGICDTESKFVDQHTRKHHQINQVLLTLLVRPSTESFSGSQKRLFNDLNVVTDEVNKTDFEPDLAIQLQSAILSCKMHDIDGLISLSTDIKNYLTVQHQELFQKLILNLENR